MYRKFKGIDDRLGYRMSINTENNTVYIYAGDDYLDIISIDSPAFEREIKSGDWEEM